MPVCSQGYGVKEESLFPIPQLLASEVSGGGGGGGEGEERG